MPNHLSAKKRIRSDLRKRKSNNIIRSKCRTLIAKFMKFVQEKKVPDATEAIKHAAVNLQKAAAKKVIHKCNASRRISRMHKKLKQIES